MKYRGILAMEEAELEAVVAEPAVDAEVVAEEQVEQGTAGEAEAMTEVEAAHDDVVASDEQIADAEDTAGTIETIEERVGEAAETEGGISEPEAAALDVAVEALLVRLGASREKAKVFPAMEGFKDKESRQQTTRIAMENLGAKVKQLWQTILNAINSVWEKVVAFIKAMLNGTKFVEGRAVLVKKLAARKGAAKAGTVKVGKWGKKIMVGGKIPNASALIKGITALSSHPAISFQYGAAATEANAAIVKALDGIGKKDGADGAAEALMNLGAILHVEKKNMALPLGDVTFVSTEKKDEAGNVSAIEVKIDGGEGDPGAEAPGLSPADAIKVADAVIANMKKFAGYEKESESIAATMKQLTSRIKGVASKETENDKEIRSIAKAIMVTKSALAIASTKARGYDLATCHAALAFAGASVAAAGKEAKAAAPAKDEKAAA